MITAEDLLKASHINPTDLPKDVVPPSVTNSGEQRLLAVAHIEAEIIPAAESEVSVPFIKSYLQKPL